MASKLSAALMLVLATATSAQAVNWASIYTAWPQNPDISAWAAEVVNCRGPYALCSFAECQIVSLGNTSQPAIAECGCYGFSSGKNYGAVAGMLSASQKSANAAACGGLKGGVCDVPNKAPWCSAQNQPTPSMYNGMFNLISTFNPKTWPYAQSSQGSVCPTGQYANCYSAGCSATTAWNGANTTCFCPVYNVHLADKTLFAVTNAKAKCRGSKGFKVGSLVWNGFGIAKQTKKV